MRWLLPNRSVLLYALALGLLLVFLQWMEFRFLLISHAYEIYITVIALLFTGLGAWLASKLLRPEKETVVVEKIVEVPVQEACLDHLAIETAGLSGREIEVLKLMAAGYSNQEIAEKLYVSLNTIKTHSSKIFEKLDVQRRTAAVEKARKMRIIL